MQNLRCVKLVPKNQSLVQMSILYLTSKYLWEETVCFQVDCLSSVFESTGWSFLSLKETDEMLARVCKRALDLSLSLN